MDIFIRDLVEDDIDELVEIEQECFPTPWSRSAFLTEIRDNKLAKYFVAELDGKVVGYGGMWLI